MDKLNNQILKKDEFNDFARNVDFASNSARGLILFGVFTIKEAFSQGKMIFFVRHGKDLYKCETLERAIEKYNTFV